MKEPAIPANEADRIQAVRSLGLLDTPPEERFDRFTRLARRVFNVPIALVTLVDEHRLWCKSCQGTDRREIDRGSSFCAHAILEDKIMIVPDTNQDDRFRDNPSVVGESGIRFYAGIPIKSTLGMLVGTLCLLDTKPRQFSDMDQQLLKDLGTMVEDEFVVQGIATVDDLTGLSNRRGFKAIATHALAMCRRQKKAATLMFFDLDGFKRVNDQYGHAEGDQVLTDIGQILLHEFRNSDVIARLGGDEFCILLTGTSAQETERPLEYLQSGIAERNKAKPYSVGFSVGTVAFDSNKHPSINELLEEADQQMYQEKRFKQAR